MASLFEIAVIICLVAILLATVSILFTLRELVHFSRLAVFKLAQTNQKQDPPAPKARRILRY